MSGLLRKVLRLLGSHRAELSILLVNDGRMRALNLQYRGMDKTTDVLSFPQQSAEVLKRRSAEVPSKFHSFGAPKLKTSEPLGDIVINLHRARKQAEEYGVSLNEEVKRLLIHGLLHLIGYDHEKSVYLRRRMEKKERELTRTCTY